MLEEETHCLHYWQLILNGQLDRQVKFRRLVQKGLLYLQSILALWAHGNQFSAANILVSLSVKVSNRSPKIYSR